MTNNILPLEELLMLPSIQKSIRYHSYNIREEDKQDLVQEFYLAIALAYDNIKDMSSAEAFCHTAIRNRKFNYFREKRTKSLPMFNPTVESDTEGERLDFTPDYISAVDPNLEFAEFQLNYMNIRDSLTDGEKKILDSIIVERRFNIADRGEVTLVAEQLGYTKAYVSKSIKKLRELLS